MRVVIVAGAPPNFMRVAPLLRELKDHSGMEPLLVHTGHHGSIPGSLFEHLEIEPPIVHLGVDPVSVSRQIGETILRLEPVLAHLDPGLVVVVGEVNSTVAAAFTTKWLGLPLAHVEAGLRSGNLSTPDEVNRILTDSIADLLFVSEASGLRNLRHEGFSEQVTHLVGALVVDILRLTRQRWTHSGVFARLGIGEDPYGVLTLRRRLRVDSRPELQRILGALEPLARRMPVLFPVQPATRPQLAQIEGPVWLAAEEQVPSSGIVCIEPLDYLDYVALISRARLVLTDASGTEEKTTALGVPCLTLRDGTSRPVTVERGTNRLVGTDPRAIGDAVQAVLSRPIDSPTLPPLWDGRAASRIVQIIDEWRRGAPSRRSGPPAALAQARAEVFDR